jgi:hypothetical protein
MCKYKRELIKGEYLDYGYCEYCEDETAIIYYDAGHERDSSHNYKICTECGKRLD